MNLFLQELKRGFVEVRQVVIIPLLQHRSEAQRLEAEWVKWQLTKSKIFSPSDQANMTDTVYQFEAMDNQGRALNLDSLRGKVILVVNVASKWA